MHGIDISNWQEGLIPSSLPIDFCICKATEGTGFVDWCCDGFIQDCKANGILWGFYHFNGRGNPETEAEFFYANTSDYFGHGIPVLDYEVENWDDRNWVERFMQRLHDLSGVWAMLYTSASWVPKFYGSWVTKYCGLWLAGYPWPNPNWTDENPPYDVSPWPFAAIWQFTSSLMLPGWGSNLDGDTAYMDAKGWMAYAGSSDDLPKPAPEPQPSPTPSASTDALVRAVLNGEYGNGDERMAKLGDRYWEVQNRIDALYVVADQVIQGMWGNGWNREQALNAAGFPYDIVQGIVNAKLGY